MRTLSAASKTARHQFLSFASFTALLLAVAIGVGSCGKKSDGASNGAGGTPPPESSTAVPRESTVVAPVPQTIGMELGEKVFKQRCMLCHGAGGHGDGIASKGLKPPPRNFHDVAYMKSRTDEQLLISIHEGKSAMPAWKKVLSEPEMRSALLYVRSLASQP